MSAVTLASGQTILLLAEHLYLTFGLVPMTGVTDSLALVLPDYAFEPGDKFVQANAMAEAILAESNAYLTSLYGGRTNIEVNLEHLIYPFWIQKMKHYCFRSLNRKAATMEEAIKTGKTEVKGYSSVRGNVSQFSTKLIDSMIQQLLSPHQTSYDEIVTHTCEEVEKLMNDIDTMADQVTPWQERGR